MCSGHYLVLAYTFLKKLIFFYILYVLLLCTPGRGNVEETDLLEILKTSVFPVVLIQIYFFFLKIDVFFGCGMSSLL